MKYIKRIVFLICLCIFLYSSYNLFCIYKEYKQGTDTYDEISTNVNIEKDTTQEIIPEIVNKKDSKDKKQEKDDKKKYVKLNVDWGKFDTSTVIGWIKIDNNKIINYPIIQSQDNEYYLHHLYNGEYNFAGSIFVDYRNDGFNDKHTIIYGHNMKNGSMFNSIKKYQNEDYANEHRYIYIATPDGETHVFYVYSCHLTSALGEKDGFNAYQISFEKDKDWYKWIKKTQDKSLITSGIEIPNEECNILTLSTCMSRGDKNERCVIHAIEILNKKN